MKMEKIQFTLEDGSIESFYIEAQTIIAGNTYLLVSDSLEGEAQVCILKDVSDPESDQACYEMVEDPEVLDAVFAVFQSELSDDEVTLTKS